MKMHRKRRKKSNRISRLLISLAVVASVALLVFVSFRPFRRVPHRPENQSNETKAGNSAGSSDSQERTQKAPLAVSKAEADPLWTPYRFKKFGCSISFPSQKLQLSFPDLPRGTEAAATDSSDEETYFVFLERSSAKPDAFSDESSRRTLDNLADAILGRAQDHQIVGERAHQVSSNRSLIEFEFTYTDDEKRTEELVRIVFMPRTGLIVKMSYRTIGQIKDRTTIRKFFDTLQIEPSELNGR